MTVGQLLKFIEKKDLEDEAEINISSKGIAVEIESVGVITYLTEQGDELHSVHVYLWEK